MQTCNLPQATATAFIGANGAGNPLFKNSLRRPGVYQGSCGHSARRPDVCFEAGPIPVRCLQRFGDGHHGQPRLYEVGKEKDALYEKPDFSDEDGLRASELEAEFAELGGWEAESEASQILQGLGVPVALHQDKMADTDGRLKVRSCLPRRCSVIRISSCWTSRRTTWISPPSTGWRTFAGLPGTVITVSTTGIFSIPSAPTSWISTTVKSNYMSATTISGTNPASWCSSSSAIKTSAMRKRSPSCSSLSSVFSANKAKSKQATARRRLLDKLTVESSLLHPALPFVGFTREREIGGTMLCHGRLQDRRRRAAAGPCLVHRRAE